MSLHDKNKTIKQQQQKKFSVTVHSGWTNRTQVSGNKPLKPGHRVQPSLQSVAHKPPPPLR